MVEAARDPQNEPLDEAARELYLAVLRNGGGVESHQLTERDHEALRRLVEIGLVIPRVADRGYTAVSPRAVTARIGVEMRAEAVRLLAGSEQVTGRFSELIQAYDQLVPTPANRPAGDWVHGLDLIQKRIAQLLSECRTDLITVQPGHRPADLLDIALQQDLPFLKRGGTLRTIYQPVALTAPATVCYATEVAKFGGQVRVLDEPFQRTVILDRRVAVIPAGDDPQAAVFLEDPAVVAHLVRVFERDWERAETPRWAESRRSDGGGSPEVRIGELMSQGLTQRMVARRLGLSERTVAGHLARLRNRYGARTLYQLGWLMRTAERAAEVLDNRSGGIGR
ncbi:DNA-binding transcriptional ArsR family regulator [Kitasatospora sp. MAA4]|uniref:LuxR C-terminal-related transcriptional regulator n=1 Tax=Kitasatospora sp. MAA4 TaxID=3035093 RepID=UPI002474EA77|nr:LuxR C-terminal-related transcriptional regulator [Kitasatospora sp. MAA4]MDH6137846.1 DNA-binding transcriptional ArsR family regulator [Kitasatospora sp. MAA4]